MSIEELRDKRTVEAAKFIDKVLEKYDFVDYSIRTDIKDMTAYLISEYVVTDNVTNPNYLKEPRVWALNVVKHMNQIISDLTDKKASERVGKIIIDVKEYEKHKDFMQLYTGWFESYDTAYYFTRDVGIPTHSVLHIHAREYKEFFNVLMYLHHTGKNYYSH